MLVNYYMIPQSPTDQAITGFDFIWQIWLSNGKQLDQLWIKIHNQSMSKVLEKINLVPLVQPKIKHFYHIRPLHFFFLKLILFTENTSQRTNQPNS